MSDVMQKIKTSIPYLHDPEVREKLEEVLEAVSTDLSEVGYEPSSDTEQSITELDTAINSFDERASTKGAELREAAAMAREEKSEDE